MTDDDKLNFVLKVLNELGYVINGTREDLTNLECNDKLNFLYSMSEKISLTILGQTKTNEFNQ